MNLLIDTNDGAGARDYTAYIDHEQLPRVSRRLNRPAILRAALLSVDESFVVPTTGSRVVLQSASGTQLFTGYLDVPAEQQLVGSGQTTVWRFLLHAVDDSCLLDHNPLPFRTPFQSRTAGSALKALANDALPGGLDVSGVQDVADVNQFVVVPQKTWTEHAAELCAMTRASYRATDGKLLFQPIGQQSFAIDEQAPNFNPTALALKRIDALHNDITIIGEVEPTTYVRDYFLGNGTTLGFYLSKNPYGGTTSTVFQEDYSGSQLEPTLWSVSDSTYAISLSGGQLCVNGGPASISFVELLELSGGLMMQHGQFTFSNASSGIVGGLYNGSISQSTCLAGFKLAPAGGNCVLQAVVNGAATGLTVTTRPGHRYALTTQVICSEAHRGHQSYFSSVHPAGDGRGGDAVPAPVRTVLTVHDVDPANPGTIAAAATVLYDGVLSSSPGFATYALINASSLFASVSFTRLQHIADAEIRSMPPGGQFHTRLNGALADGGECYVTSTGVLEFYPPYPPEPYEEVVVAYRSSGRAMARVQDSSSIAQHAQGGDGGRRTLVRHLKWPPAPTSMDCENAASALLDDATQPAWTGEYETIGEGLGAEDVLPGDGVRVSAPSRGATFDAVVREVGVEVMSLADDRSLYTIKFANDAAEPLAFEVDAMTLGAPIGTVFELDAPSASRYIATLTNAQITNVIASELTIDAGVAPPSGGGIEVRRSDGGWGPSDSGNLAGRFTTQTFTLPRLSRVQGYYLRQYDGSAPRKYSRYSMLLHVDYPL